MPPTAGGESTTNSLDIINQLIALYNNGPFQQTSISRERVKGCYTLTNGLKATLHFAGKHCAVECLLAIDYLLNMYNMHDTKHICICISIN